MEGAPKPDFRCIELGLGGPSALRLCGEAKRPQALGEGEHLALRYNSDLADQDTRRVIYQLLEAGVLHAVKYLFVTSVEYTSFIKLKKGPQNEIIMKISAPLHFDATAPSVKLVLFYLTMKSTMERAAELSDGSLWPAGGIRLQGLAKQLFCQPETGRPKRQASTAGAVQQGSGRQQHGQQRAADAWGRIQETFGSQPPISRADLRLGERLSHSSNASVIPAHGAAVMQPSR
jgi:hypothetical protein